MPANWFWQPDTTWVNEVNTTNLRSISGIRMATAFVAVGLLAFGYATYQAFPWHLEPCTAPPCLEPLGRARAADFAKTIYDSMGWFLAALMGIALGGYLGKRLSDTDHRVKVEEAKKAPIMNVTQERPALPPTVPTKMTVTATASTVPEPEGPASTSPEQPPSSDDPASAGKAVEP